MAKSDFIPVTDADFLAWLENFVAQAEPRPAETGLPDAQFAALKGAAAEFRAKLAAHNQAQAAARHASEDKKASRAAAVAIGRAAARQIKAGPGYRDAIGALLGIVGAEDGSDAAGLKPSLTAQDQTGGVVVLSFSKGRTDGVNIYLFDVAAQKYDFLARDTVSPYVDNRPLAEPGKPEIRRYTAVHVIDDEEVGQFSDEVVVACAP